MIADTKLQIDQFQRKMEAKFNKHFCLKIEYFKSQNDHKLSSNQLDLKKNELIRMPIGLITSEL